jgi:nitrogen-specific signal transduction histidine kinase
MLTNIKDFAPGVPKIQADPEQLQQVFLNLFLDGIDAIAEKCTIRITTLKVQAIPFKSRYPTPVRVLTRRY